MLAYLVVREGPKWTDVFRLLEGRTVTIGRAPTNQIVVKDDRCSRNHAEVFHSNGDWVLRDLSSRNGTEIDGEKIGGDYTLKDGDIFKVAHAQLAFVHDLTAAFPGDSRNQFELNDLLTDHVGDSVEESAILSISEPTTITHRRGKTKFHGSDDEVPASEAEEQGSGQAAAKLCRLAFVLGNTSDEKEIAELALESLFDGTPVDAGAVYLLPRNLKGDPADKPLRIIGSRSDLKPKYNRLSKFLSQTVLREGEAVLARNVESDSTLVSRDSQGEISATSVMCAPIRQNGVIIGVIHTYSTDETRRPDPDDLEFTLAVADNVALALTNLNRTQELSENLEQVQTAIRELRSQLGENSQLIGTSAAMEQVHQEILRAAPSRATVLIRGESGVGKELVARAVHFASPRKDHTFVCLNCAALSETLLESELFGHEKGSFTGATERKIGKFEAADQGTLMLDEIGEMSEQIQAKFLRVLEGHPFERVGGSQAISCDVRVIAATNRDLERAVTEGRFRRDLYFRLNVVEILVPPLRKRDDKDIMELAQHFLSRYSSETGRRLKGFTQSAIEQLQEYRWPGNVRELRNVIERAVVLARNDYIGIDDLHLSNLATAGDSGVIVDDGQVEFEPITLAEAERRHIVGALNANGWNKSRTAKILGIERSTLDRKIRRYELKKDVDGIDDDDA